MNQALYEKQKLRFHFLNKMYEISAGNTETLISGEGVAIELGYQRSTKKSVSAVNFLRGKYLIEDVNFVAGPLGILKITPRGICEIEAALSKPELPTQHFPPINILKTKN